MMLQPKREAGSGFVTVLFFIWGLIGFGVCIFAALGAPILTAIFSVLLWIGGMLFFGILVLTGSTAYRLSAAIPVYVVATPRDDGLNQEYRGVPYMKLEGGQIIAESGDGKHTFKNWKKFVEAFPDEEVAS